VLEQSLRSGTCGAVLAWLEKGDAEMLDHLRQAAEAGNTWGVLFRVVAQKKQLPPVGVPCVLSPIRTQLKMVVS